MQVEQRVKYAGRWSPHAAPAIHAHLVLVFGSSAALRHSATWDELRSLYPGARIVACSTAGEIADTRVLDDSLVVTAIAFQHSRCVLATVPITAAGDSATLGSQLAASLPGADLMHVLVLSDGLHVNGSALVTGMMAVLPANVVITGGLSADGARFQQTSVCVDGPAPADQVVAIGLYGQRLQVGYGSLGGWDAFGPERRVTKSHGNMLYELDGEPALDLYKRYLGPHALELPASGLLFPLVIRGDDDTGAVVRTILAVDEQTHSLTFAGDVPQGYRARLLRANFQRLIDGAAGAAQATRHMLGTGQAELAILISCVGRKLVLKQRIEEEVEAVRQVLGASTALTGFYSYGEISPLTPNARCELHNQTMTITTLSER